MLQRSKISGRTAWLKHTWHAFRTNSALQHRAYAKPADLAATLHQKEAWDAFPDDVQKLAVYAEHARVNNYQIPLLSRAAPDLDLNKAYHITAAIRALRESTNGEIVAGRKLAFAHQDRRTNQTVDSLCWSYMYRNTVIHLPEPESLAPGKEVVANIGRLSAMEPKIEPHIVLGDISRPLKSSMSDAELLESIGWIAQGLEVAASIFPGWKYTTPDAAAAFAFHGLLFVGQKLDLRDPNISQFQDLLLHNLGNVTLELSRSGKKVEDGGNAHVLGSPVTMLRQLLSRLEHDEHNAPVKPGEVIASGALTRSSPIRDGDAWSTDVLGLDLPGLRVRFKL